MSEPIYVEFKDVAADKDESLSDAWLIAIPRVGDTVRVDPDYDIQWQVVEVDWSIEHEPPGTPRRAMVQCLLRKYRGQS